MKTLFITFTIYLLSEMMLIGQEQHQCLPPRINKTAEELVKNARVQGRTMLPSDKLIKIFIHICRNDDGSQAAASFDEIEDEFNDLINSYTNNQVCFALMGVEFIDDTDLNDMNTDEDFELLMSYNIPGCLTVYYHTELGNGEDSFGGAAYDTPNYFCSINNGNIGVNSISHEIGHCLGLNHTHTTEFGEAYIDGTDCDNNGDRVCDTPADPYSGDDCFSSFGCSYTGTCTDPAGATNYAPQYNNIMSYWWTTGCPRNWFTQGQINRCHEFLETIDFLIELQSPNDIIYGPVTESTGIIMMSAIQEITTTGEVVLSNSVIASFSSRSVTLKRGFHANPGIGIVRVIAGACNY